MADTLIAAETGHGARPIHLVRKGDDIPGGEATRAWARAHDFTGGAVQLLIAPGPDGAPSAALFGVGERFEPFAARALAARLPTGDWR